MNFERKAEEEEATTTTKNHQLAEKKAYVLQIHENVNRNKWFYVRKTDFSAHFPKFISCSVHCANRNIPKKRFNVIFLCQKHVSSMFGLCSCRALHTAIYTG